MDIIAINDAIQSLENEATTPDNVAELASLYIVQSHLENGVSRMVDSTEKELNDIFPAYKKYVDTKRRYQLGQTYEGEVIADLKLVCLEIKEFINILNKGTDMHKERLCIQDMIKQLNKKYT